MMASVMKPFEGQGYNVWADNAFVSVATCIDCKAKKINFVGTTRTTFGRPDRRNTSGRILALADEPGGNPGGVLGGRGFC